MKIRMALLFIITLAICAGLSCACHSQERNRTQVFEATEKYLTDVFEPKLHEILFDKEPYEYKVKYEADFYLTVIEGRQDVIYFETFFIYKEDDNGKMINCKTVMITKPELNQRYMEEYLFDVYGATYEYTKTFDNVYVHMEDVL